MEFKTSTIVAILAIFMLAVQALAQPMLGEPDLGGDLTAEKRPKYLDTRTMEEFKNALLVSLGELINDGKVNPDVLGVSMEESKTKRGRYMDICVKKTKTGAFVPHLCWKGEDPDETAPAGAVSSGSSLFTGRR